MPSRDRTKVMFAGNLYIGTWLCYLAEVTSPMAGAFHFCISDPTLPPISDQDENAILHVQFHGTGKNDYRLDYEEVDCTLLTKFLKERLKKDFNEKLIKLTFDITPPAQDVKDFCGSVLERGIHWNQRVYLFLGHSETQLKKKSCYLLNESHEEIHQLLALFGDFLGEENVEKRARKIGMLFSPLKETQPLDTTQYKLEPDIEHGVFRSYTFTDGCGFMSSEFSSEVQKTLKLGYQPSVVQVRYRGIEGLLVLKEDLTEVKVQFHYSMQKFATPDENMPESLNFVDLLDYSRPYENGYLDAQMIMLLADRGVPLQNLEKLQSGYHELLEGMCKETAEYFLRFKGELSLLQIIKTTGIDGQMKKRLKSLRNEELDRMKKATGYTRILVPQSRVVFAVCDPYNKIKYGECYFNPTMSDDEAKSFPGASQKFVVTRSPCHHPGDVRVLRLTDDKEGYEKLRDCLVLPVEGPRPHALECAGGTLGGDKFFVSWNKNLFPKALGKPCLFPLKKSSGIRKSMANLASDTLWPLRISPLERNEKGRQEMCQYFVNFTDEQLTEKFDATYMKYAAVFGPSSKECQKLSKRFYQAVNLMEDRVTLRKKWLKLKESEPGLESTDNPSTSTHSERSSVADENEERENVEEHRPDETIIIRLQRFMRRSERSSNPGNAFEVREKIEANAREFVQRVQREFQQSRVA